MSDPTPNMPLLRKALDWVRVEATKPHKESAWHQEVWHLTAAETAEIGWTCGTAYCVAGYVAALDGPIRKLPFQTPAFAHDGRLVAAYAQDVLGITGQEASSLFYANHDVEDVERVAERIAARAGERL